MSDPHDWLGAGPDYNATAATRIEDGAVRVACRVGRKNAAAVARHCGLGAADRLTFAHLREAADFPYAPGVTAEPLDPLDVLLGKFRKSRLYPAWSSAWDQRPGVGPSRRFLIMRASGLSYAVAYSGLAPDRPHVAVGHAELGRPLLIEPLSAWLRSLDWAAPAGDSADD